MALPPVAAALPHASERATIRDVVKEFFATKQKEVVKIFGYATGWTSIFLQVGSNSELAGRISTDAGWIKNGLSALETPGKLMDLHLAVKNFYDKPSLSSARIVLFSKTTSVINSVSDSIDFGSRIFPVASETMKVVKGVNYTATLIGAGNGAIEQFQKLAKKPDGKTIGLIMINVARDTSYVGLAVIGLAGMASLITTAPWMFLACLTSGLSFTIIGFFYERLVETQGSNKHLDPHRVNANWIVRNQNLQNDRDHWHRLVPAAV
ncbi:MAG: hypothetical protein HYZ48_05155 [Chlamydiales bacterium]|nr:hypothetical protein [Chlamydiales bacterium]